MILYGNKNKQTNILNNPYVQVSWNWNVYFQNNDTNSKSLPFVKGTIYVPFAGQKNEKVKFQLHLKDNTNLELP